LKIMSEVMILLPNTDRIQQVEDNVRGWRWVLKKVKIFTGFINKHLIEETAALKVSTEPLTTMGYGWQPVAVRYRTRESKYCLIRYITLPVIECGR
jgi:hypothetical protein